LRTLELLTRQVSEFADRFPQDLWNNGREPSAYLNHLFEQLPAADTVEALEALLPWNVRGALSAARRAA
jgi:hypothetical protein